MNALEKFESLEMLLAIVIPLEFHVAHRLSFGLLTDEAIKYLKINIYQKKIYKYF